MAQFNVPSETARNSLVVETFRGVDLNNSPSNVDKSRSPAAPNMIRDQVGKVRKRMGYTTKLTAPEGAAINGVHHLLEETLIHAGAKLYRLVKATDGTWILTEIGAMANARSRSFVFDQKLYLLDSATYQVYDGETLSAVADNATVPTIIISRRPTGGGQVYEGLNLLGKKWTESFLGTTDATEYQLTTKELSDDPVTAKMLDAEGNWVDKVENTDFTVDREKGIVTFTTAPGESPVKGQDNVQITASKVREDYLDAINKCTIAALYGVGGSTDRVFLSGNAAKPGIDWYSNFEDPAFFPDTNYTKLVRDGGEVTGYAVLSNTLAAFINGASDERNVVVRGGTLDEDGDALFRVSNTMIGQDAVAPDTFCRTDKEPLFLTERGVFAITAENTARSAATTSAAPCVQRQESGKHPPVSTVISTRWRWVAPSTCWTCSRRPTSGTAPTAAINTNAITGQGFRLRCCFWTATPCASARRTGDCAASAPMWTM